MEKADQARKESRRVTENIGKGKDVDENKADERSTQIGTNVFDD